MLTKNKMTLPLLMVQTTIIFSPFYFMTNKDKKTKTQEFSVKLINKST